MSVQQLSRGALLDGRYRILRVLGHGGTGTVYLAQHIQLDTTIALKEVRGRDPEDADYREALEQSRREGRLMVRLDHPNLPKVTDAFIANDGFYLAMEYLEGVTAQQQLQKRGGRPLEVEQVLQWGIQIVGVLDYLHSQDPPIIFRDLKPDNIIVQRGGSVKLIDFGIARRFTVGARNDTVRFGSVGFSPPEQFGLQQTDGRSDIYSLGATLHCLLTGHDPARQPFRLPPAAQLNPAIPSALSELISRCVALEPARRPADAAEVQRGLLAIRDGRAVVCVPAQGSNGATTACDYDTAASIRPVDREAATVSGSQHERLPQPHRPAWLWSRKRSWLLIGVPFLAAVLYPLLWLMQGNGRAANVPASHPAVSAKAEASVPVRFRNRLPSISGLSSMPHRRTGNSPLSQIENRIPAGKKRDGAEPRPDDVSLRRRKGRIESRITVTRRMPHNHTARLSNERNRKPLQHSAPDKQNNGGAPPADHMHDTDLETVLGSDKK